MNLHQKIAFVQNAIDGLNKDGMNPHFKNGYVKLNQIIDAFRPLEVEQQLSITMPLTNVMGHPAITLRIVDLANEADDEAVEETMMLPEITDPQKMGSAISYYRRYMLMSFFNLKAEDDDGQTASSSRPMSSQEISDRQLSSTPKKITRTDNDEI